MSELSEMFDMKTIHCVMYEWYDVLHEGFQMFYYITVDTKAIYTTQRCRILQSDWLEGVD